MMSGNETDWPIHAGYIEIDEMGEEALDQSCPSKSEWAAHFQERTNTMSVFTELDKALNEAIEQANKELEGHTCRRLRTRSVDVEEVVARTVLDAKKSEDGFAITIEHGGSVANAYGYPASTECVVVVANAKGAVYITTGRLPANKITESGVAANLLGEYARALFDDRFGEDKKDAARKHIIEAIFG